MTGIFSKEKIKKMSGSLLPSGSLSNLSSPQSGPRRVEEANLIYAVTASQREGL